MREPTSMPRVRNRRPASKKTKEGVEPRVLFREAQIQEEVEEVEEDNSYVICVSLVCVVLCSILFCCAYIYIELSTPISNSLSSPSHHSSFGRKVQPTYVKIQVSLANLYTGGTFTSSDLGQKHLCTTCSGSGADPAHGIKMVIIYEQYDMYLFLLIISW